MTLNEAKNLKSFTNRCTCGGYAWTMNGRNPARPHLYWCPQEKEYNEWFDLVGEDFLRELDRKKIKSKLGYSRIGLDNV